MGTNKNERHELQDARKGRKSKGAAWQGFVDIPLSSEDKELLASTDVLSDDVFGMLAWLLDAGYKVSITSDTAHNCYIASATGVSDACINAGYTTSGRGPSLERAVHVLYHKVVYLAKEGLWTNVGGDRSLAAWG